MKSNASFFGLALSILISTLPSSAVEPWADHGLTVTNGLELWLDASHELAARSPDGALLLASDMVLDIWHDASGHHRDLYQPVPESRPRLFHTGTESYVRFDGSNDFMMANGLNQSLKQSTVFIMAAPHGNAKQFGAFLSMNRNGSNDYSSGLNVDMATGAKDKFDYVNVEGEGFFGIKNLMTSPVPLKEMHVLSVLTEPGTNVTDLRVDGIAQEQFFRPVYHAGGNLKASREVGEHAFGFDQVTVGVRFFSNTAEPPHVQGFFEGDIAAVLIYNRILTETECASVESFLKSKLLSRIPGRVIVPLAAVSNAPPVQVFLPGFTVRELPVTLNNINNVRYRPDGKLVALGYDGNIWLLSDTDGDGLEDKVTPFWTNGTLRSSIGMALTPPNYPRGQGVFVSSKTKFSLIVDTNHDDVADQEIVVAKGWPESFHQVDTLGAAVDKDGSVYFGIGTVNFADAYLVDKNTGKSSYNLKDERGTILKVSADLSHREIFCTGIRFPVGMAFNSSGDLFCTDQEGATWLPNGNPLDELLQIQPGRHYGFPPRHPKHLPNVIDEPSVFDYGPQHQSTCGLAFNEPVNGGPTFGPDWWRGDALIAGESRGKLFRTKLVKTPAGYVAQNQLFACLNMLTIDLCVTPQGDLLVSTHSGKPDWGSGPTGKGKLYKISYSDKDIAQPVAVWPASETETCVEFNRALDARELSDWSKRISVTQGRYVSAGDQFESLRPGYQAVQNQLLQPRYKVNVLSTAIAADGKTLVVRTEPRREAVNYAVILPSSPTAPQSEIDLAHDLMGVQAEWVEASGKKDLAWLPHFDLTVARGFTKPLASREQFWTKLSHAGKLTMRTQLNLWEMLRAATQPISKLDFTYPDETVTLVLKANVRLDAIAAGMKVERVGENEVHLSVVPRKASWLPLEMALTTSGRGEPTLDVSWFTAEDSRPRALPLRRILLPWATLEKNNGEREPERVIPEIAGGNWLRGKKLFHSEQVGCYKCHLLNGSGGKIGPDLSNLVFRDYASVLKDVLEPSAAINPDHVAYNVELKNGEALTGVMVGGSDTAVKFADATGKITTIAKAEIQSQKPSTISLMPEGLIDALNAEQRKDLFTFLLMPSPIEPAAIEAKGEPAPRSRAEMEAILKKGSPTTGTILKPLRIVLCSGPKDHGPGEHDYPLWERRWSKLLALAEKVSVETVSNWPSADQFAKADIIVFYSNNPGWSADRGATLDTFLNRGGGLAYLHYAVDGHDKVPELAQRIGLAWRGGGSKFRHGALDLKMQPHAITEGFGDTHFVDESYWQLIGDTANIQLLASGMEEGKAQPLMWVREQGKGRVFVSIPGHFTWTFDDPLFRILLLRGMAWSAHEPVDRFSELVDVGARIGD